LKKIVLFAVLCSVILLLMPMVSSVETRLVEDEIKNKFNNIFESNEKYLYAFDKINILRYGIDFKIINFILMWLLYTGFGVIVSWFWVNILFSADIPLEFFIEQFLFMLYMTILIPPFNFHTILAFIIQSSELNTMTEQFLSILIFIYHIILVFYLILNY